MSNTICYTNTDLDLTSPDDLTNLALALESRGLFSLHVTREGNGFWCAKFETNVSYREPQTNITALIDAINSLEEPHHSAWFGCTVREFNIGYECGAELPSPIRGVARPHGRGGHVAGITLYPIREPKAANTRLTGPEDDA